jgi:hypothetical protein
VRLPDRRDRTEEPIDGIAGMREGQQQHFEIGR